MFLDLTPYVAPLSRTPAMLRAVVEEQPDAWLDRRHAPDVVSPREAVAHLLLCEAEDSWPTRIRRLREPARPLPSGPYDGIGDVELATRPPGELLDEFEAWRGRNVRELEAMRLTPEDLETGRTDPEFGIQTVGNVLATWVAHDLYHLGGILKSYASPYADRIGPYQRFLNLPHFN